LIVRINAYKKVLPCVYWAELSTCTQTLTAYLSNQLRRSRCCEVARGFAAIVFLRDFWLRSGMPWKYLTYSRPLQKTAATLSIWAQHKSLRNNLERIPDDQSQRREKSSNEDVKSFAQRVVEDHRKNCLCHLPTFQDQTGDNMDAREADFNCRMVPKIPDSEHLRGLPRRVISREVHLTNKW